MKARLRLVAVGVAVIVLIIILILIGYCVITLEYYEMGYLRSRTAGTVYTDRLYQGGLIKFSDPDKQFKVFNKSAHFVTFTTTVYTGDRLEIGLKVSFQYFLRPHQMDKLHKKFDVYYEPILKKNALDALKNAATFYSTREYLRDRVNVESGLKKAIQERLGGKCCEQDCTKEGPDKCQPSCKPYGTCIEDDFGLFTRVRYFQLGGINIPSELDSRFQRALILSERQARAKLLQEAIIIRKTSDQLVNQIENEANVILNQASANSTLILQFATNEGGVLKENARRDGLKSLYGDLNITTQEQRAAFDYLRTLRRSGQARLAVAYSQYIAGTLK